METTSSTLSSLSSTLSIQNNTTNNPTGANTSSNSTFVIPNWTLSTNSAQSQSGVAAPAADKTFHLELAGVGILVTGGALLTLGARSRIS